MKNYIIYSTLIMLFISCTDDKQDVNKNVKEELTKTTTSTINTTKVVNSYKTNVPRINEVPKAMINDKSPTIEKKGFLTTKWCAENGMLADCRMESILCGYGGCFKDWDFEKKEIMQLVLYVHDDLKYYNIQPSKILDLSHMLELGINRNLVSITGKFDSENNIIAANKFSAPPPPKKEFFKGCL